ncbi:MAG: hypothetical protein ABI690_22950 [Chloroflexota bacterium]
MVRSADNKKILVIFLVLTLTIGAVVLTISSLRVTLAQNSTENMQSLFERIDEQIKANQGFMISIQFQTPIIENEPVWVIPDTREKDGDEVSVAISEIGDDYVCFDALRGSARYMECTPYSNIASIRYFVN